MDRATLAIYDAEPQKFAQRWLDRGKPSALYAQIEEYFKPGGLTAEVGCGSGRDMAWLAAHGYPVTGYDASAGLLAQAKALCPHLDFVQASLPELDGVGAHQFDNVLCKAVIMHLPQEEIAPAVHRLLDLLKPGGVLHLSWRVTKNADERDKYGRLYSAFAPDVVHAALAGAQVLFEDEQERADGTVLHSLIARTR